MPRKTTTPRSAAVAGHGIVGGAPSDGIPIAAAALGLGALLAASAFWFALVKWIRIACPVRVDVQEFRAVGAPAPLPDKTTETSAPDSLAILKQSFLMAAGKR